MLFVALMMIGVFKFYRETEIEPLCIVVLNILSKYKVTIQRLLFRCCQDNHLFPCLKADCYEQQQTGCANTF